VRLVDLMPRWVHPNVFAFLCPHCRDVFLSCKNVVMARREQCEIFEADPIGAAGVTVVLCKPEMAWNYPTGADFRSITVTPSLDAGASGHWHGRIIEGEIK
jgi:hypothetical protein